MKIVSAISFFPTIFVRSFIRMPQPTLVSPIGYSNSSCGYCSTVEEKRAQKERGIGERKESASYGLWAHQMSVEAYDLLINQGWRRSGQYVYHPDMARTCCPQYTIRLEAGRFNPGKRQRRVLHKFNRFILTGAEEVGAGQPHPLLPSGRKPCKGRNNVPFSLSEMVHLPEDRADQARRTPSNDLPNRKDKSALFQKLKPVAKDPVHRFKVSLHSSDPPHQAVHPLFVRYQQKIHRTEPDSSSLEFGAFSRFLCVSPLSGEPIRYASGKDKLKSNGLPNRWGTWHMLYEIDEEVVAFAVLDIVPTGVSSVYFCYDPTPKLGSMNWGKISALREISLVEEMKAAGIESMKYQYFGYYIHSCQKMRYKGEYQPSELLDPGTNEYHPLNKVTPYLELYPRGYFPFSSIPSVKPPPALWSSLSRRRLADQGKEDNTNSHDDDDDGEEEDDSEEDDDDEHPLPTDPPPPSFLQTSSITPSDLKDIRVMTPRGFTELIWSGLGNDREKMKGLRELVAGLKASNASEKGLLDKEESEVGLVVVAL